MVVLPSLMAIIVQSLGARLAIATGQDLASACCCHYGRTTLVGLWITVAIAICVTGLAGILGAAIAISARSGSAEDFSCTSKAPGCLRSKSRAGSATNLHVSFISGGMSGFRQCPNDCYWRIVLKKSAAILGAGSAGSNVEILSINNRNCRSESVFS